ncbi:hypothetical protein HA402_000579 [Bradysia odoriphaga]|nr:hypothetical protein HA402_000579 [Bradysia odoriphaga]
MWTGREGDENKEATWEEYSDFYKNLYRSITVSEFDRPHKTVVYCNEQDIPACEVNGCSNIPQINFLSQYYILTHQAEVNMPSGHIDQPKVEDNRDGTVRVQYDPREEGVHELEVKYNGEQVKGSPYKFHVDSIASGSVTAYGPGLTQGITGEPCSFTISTKGAGAGGMSLAVDGPSKAEISFSDNKDGTVTATYLPTAPGDYKVSVRYGDKNIKGSPFLAKITGDGKKRNQVSVPSCTEMVLSGGNVSDADLRTLNGSIQTPSGLEEPCFLKRMPSGNIGISFTPRQVGEHSISIKRQGKHIHNSPFKLNFLLSFNDAVVELQRWKL